MEINQPNKPNQPIFYILLHVNSNTKYIDFTDYADFTPFKACRVKISAFTTNLMGVVE